MLDALGSEMLAPEHVATFVAEFTAEWNRIQSGREGEQVATAAEQRKVGAQTARLIDAVADGSMPGLAVRDRLADLERTSAGLTAKLAQLPTKQVRLHPNLAELYRERVATLREQMAAGDGAEVVERARALIERIVLHPLPEKGFRIEVLGELAAMVRLGQNAKSPLEGALDGITKSATKVVAGTGFEPVTFRL